MVAVKRTPRVRSRGSSRPVSADGMMMLQSEPSSSRGVSPASSRPGSRRAKSSMAKVHSAHGAGQHNDSRPAATFALDDEGSDEEDRFISVAKSDGVYTDGARQQSRAKSVRAAASHYPQQRSKAAAAAGASFGATVDDDYASDDWEEESEALHLAVPEYQATVMVARNAERDEMQQYFRAAAEHPNAQPSTPSHRAVPGVASFTAGAAQSSSSLDPGMQSPQAGGGDQPAPLQLDMRGLLAGERAKHAVSVKGMLGEGLFSKALSFWQDAYTKGGGPGALAQPEVATKVKRTITALCANDERKVGAFYQVEALVWRP